MFGNITQYFSEKVLPEYIIYVKQRKNNKSGLSKDVSTGTNSAISLYHFREHLEKFSEEWDKSYDDLLELCPNYNLLGEVVNATKHAIRNKKNRKLTNAENIYEEIRITIYRDKKGEYKHVQKEIIVKLDSGEEIILYNLLTDVINMWINELKSIGLFYDLSLFTESTRLPRRNKDSGKLGFITTENFYGRSFKLQKYNYEKKIVEPIDLTGFDIKMNICEKLYPITLSIKPNDDSEEIQLDMDITEKQMKKIKSIKNPNLRLREILFIADEKGLINKEDKK